MLAKLVRMYCVDNHITHEYLAAKHQAYCEAILFITLSDQL